MTCPGVIINLFSYLTVAVSPALDGCTVISGAVVHDECVVSCVVFVKCSNNENFC